jgi:quinol monooxygenase YgiN
MGQNGYAVFVEVDVVPERIDECLAMTLAAATRNVADDPGCRQIDVSLKADGSPTIMLYEVYESSAAFDAHIRMPGFLSWREETRSMVVGMRMIRLNHIQSSFRQPPS